VTFKLLPFLSYFWQLRDLFTDNGCYLGLNVAKGGLNKPVTQCSDRSQDGRACQKLCDSHWASVEVVEMRPHIRRIMDKTSTCNRVLLCRIGGVWPCMICDQ